MPDMKRKYLLRPGLVRSQKDGDEHYIGVSQLMQLYGVMPGECVIDTPDRSRWHSEEHLVILSPRTDGNYALPDKSEDASMS